MTGNQDVREYVIQKARERYVVAGETLNITEALRLYLENDATEAEKIPLRISTPERHQIKLVTKMVRPRCDDCDAELYLQANARDPDGKAHPTAWVCKTCGVEYYSDKTLAEWLKELQDEARKQKLRNADEPDGAIVPAGRQEVEI